MRTFPTGGSLSYNATLRPERLQFSSVLCRGMRMFRSGRFALPCIPVYCRCDSRECTEDENRKRARSCLALLREGLRIFHLLFFFSREWQRGASGLYAGKYYCLAVPIIRIGLCSGSILTPCRLLATDTSTDAVARDFLMYGRRSQKNFTSPLQSTYILNRLNSGDVLF